MHGRRLVFARRRLRTRHRLGMDECLDANCCFGLRWHADTGTDAGAHADTYTGTDSRTDADAHTCADTGSYTRSYSDTHTGTDSCPHAQRQPLQRHAVCASRHGADREFQYGRPRHRL